ncbi:cation efflux protein [Thelephora terrestris]|uniref:Cation efflux protein n=1 Tax=Thelephora terrestris TaxID=56493 RepID=A0A9P6HI10_9AGAM|nr:cation efflux protein [Thelephora terrestris]
MEETDSRTRQKVTLNPIRVLSRSLTNKVLPQLLVAHSFHAVGLYAGKEWVLSLDAGVPWLLIRVLALGGLGFVAWEVKYGKLFASRAVEWSVMGMASLFVLLQHASLLATLGILSPVRVIILTQYSTVWPKVLTGRSSARNSFFIVVALLLSLASDANYSYANLGTVLPGYTALAFHGLASVAFEQTQSVFPPSVTPQMITAASALGSCFLAVPLYVFRMFMLEKVETPSLPISSLVVIPLLAASLTCFTPTANNALKALPSPSQVYPLSFLTLSVFTVLFGFLAFAEHPTWVDPLFGILLYIALDPKHTQEKASLTRNSTGSLLRSYLKAILANPESRKIFYFLILNMWFMIVQMLYGVWTNSLGLISDAIHMAFDCMAIAVGLIASVMATWPANERFTYGYGRIETLSGFANGIFLILISIFIVFEAIQRILDPPEMNTNQLLLVSSLGLGVNLFGMFAMGGHHHHGHSHSHGSHSHGHGHGHSHGPPSPESPERENGSIGDDHHDHHGHGHSHSNPSRSDSQPPKSHSHSHLDGHSHSHPQSHFHSQSHVPLPPSVQTSPSRNHLHATASRDHSNPQPPSRSHSHSPEHSHVDGNCSHSHSHTNTSQTTSTALTVEHPHSRSTSPSRKRPVNIPPLNISPPEEDITQNHRPCNPVMDRVLGKSEQDSIPSPITPSYQFGQDDHYDKFHHAEKSPNLHDHSHAHDSHEGHSHNMRGVFLHVMADTLGSVGVIISTILIRFYGWTGFDPIASLFIAILIAASVVPLVIDTGRILALDVSEKDTSIESALKELGTVEGLASFTYPRFWPKDSSSMIGSIHLQLALSASSYDPHGPHSTTKRAYANMDRVVERVDYILRSRIQGLEELTIQVEEGKPEAVVL